MKCPECNSLTLFLGTQETAGLAPQGIIRQEQVSLGLEGERIIIIASCLSCETHFELNYSLQGIKKIERAKT